MIERELKLALKARLETVTKANGYLTDSGLQVKLGWPAYAISAFNRGDMIAIQPNTTDSQPHTQSLHDCELGVLIVGITSEPDEPDLRLDEFLTDFRKAMFTGAEIDQRIIDIRQDGKGEYELDEDGGLAYLHLPIRIQYQADFLT
ncbi:hypothetical protein HPT27_10585 [Permianibacter sp. IMCC34836]|uniref:hypothetical protein n=1 Tax=Permianibacter fluminis TaxID=2738515 RepID=UPI001552005B|nr:hypothetical protein [Permianibacter fluminis]NQD37474.1 hypothetical protein [Permianibacter fluminis]